MVAIDSYGDDIVSGDNGVIDLLWRYKNNFNKN